MARDLRQLTSLRFFAAMWVVAFNYWPSLHRATPPVIGKGYLGVELFFTLSGFILCHAHLDRLGQGRFDYRGFLKGRLARLYPLHLVTLIGLGLVAGAAGALGLHAGSKLLIWPSLPANLLLIHAWGVVASPGWNHPSWSLSAEWFAYLLFPVIAGAAWRLRRRPIAAAVGAGVFVVVTYSLFPRWAGFPLSQATVAWGALRVLPGFVLGSAINLLWRARPLRAAKAAWGVAALCTLTFLSASLLQAPDWTFVLAFAGLIFALASAAGAGSGVLAGPVPVYLGQISFALYMAFIPWQLIVENTARKLAHLEGAALPLPLWLMMLAGTVPAAMALHHGVERPAQALIARSGRSKSRRPTAALGAPAFQS